MLKFVSSPFLMFHNRRSASLWIFFCLFCTDISSVILKCTVSDRKVFAKEHFSAAVKQRGYRDAMLIANLLLCSWTRDSRLKKCVNPLCECLKVSVSYKAFHCVQCSCSGVAFVNQPIPDNKYELVKRLQMKIFIVKIGSFSVPF